MWDTQVEDEQLLVCVTCGYWGGIGFREWNSQQHAAPLRGVIARYKPILPIDSNDTSYLVSHLRRSPKDLTSISPNRAEKFVANLLADYLSAEVRPLGGVKDEGVDAYVVNNDKIASIVQVKWRESERGAESVGVVREVAGTLLARGVPSGILVSTRSKFSKPAQKEAEVISQREAAGVGKLSLTLLDYHDIIDMLELSSTKLTEEMTINDWYQISDDYCVFDGAAMIGQQFIERMGAQYA